MVPFSEKIKSIPGEFRLEQNLSSGPISQIFLCTFQNVKAVIRFDHSYVPMLSVDRASEVFLLNSIEPLMLAPNIIYQDLSEGILIWKYISGNMLNFEKKNKKNYMQLLGKSLSKVHAFVPPKDSADVFANSMKQYKNLLENTSHSNLMNRGLKLYRKLADDGLNFVLSHNDLNRENIILGDRIYFLDWEYAGINHPFFDIATLVKTFSMSADDLDNLLTVYFENKQFHSIKNIDLWITFVNLLDEIWKESIDIIAKKN